MSWIADNTPVWLWLLLAGGGGAAVLAFVPGALALVLSLWAAMPRWLKGTIIGILTLGMVFIAGRKKGADNEKARRDAANARAQQTRREVDEEVRKDSNADIDRKLDRWLRND